MNTNMVTGSSYILLTRENKPHWFTLVKKRERLSFD